MDYHRSYILNNFKKKDPSKGYNFDNLTLIRSLHGCKAEAGFILSHVSINQFSGQLISCIKRINNILELTAQGPDTPKIHPLNLNEELQILDDVVSKIVNELRGMYQRSNANDYYTFRTFMMGTKGT
jgi:indoleamine 2,3-dioxygenase